MTEGSEVMARSRSDTPGKDGRGARAGMSAGGRPAKRSVGVKEGVPSRGPVVRVAPASTAPRVRAASLEARSGDATTVVGPSARLPNPIHLAGEPVLQYQPAVDLATGRLLGFEALVRWSRPDGPEELGGHIMADVLIPWAEASDNVADLDEWVLMEACSTAQGWVSGVQIAVNCSTEDFHSGRASKSVKAALEVSRLNPDRLTVEVSERTIADSSCVEDLVAVAAQGVHLAVDDVGTRWTSLQPLRELQVDTVKIDRSFVAGLEVDAGMNRCVVEALLNVSHSLAMSTVAEGIETYQQLTILQEFGVDVGQGYFFSSPLASDVADELATAEQRPVFSLGPGHDKAVHGTEHIQRVGPIPLNTV